MLALDAHSGALVWSRPHAGSNCNIPYGAGPCYTTSSPALDPGLQYVYTYSLYGQVAKHRVGDGTEVVGSGWPAQVTLRPDLEKGSSALSIVTTSSGASFAYMTLAAYPTVEGTPGYDYQGHLVAINLADASTEVFNAGCSDQTGLRTGGTVACEPVGLGIWARPGTIYDPDTGRLYAATGNGLYAPGSFAWGDSVVALNPDGTGAGSQPLDSYTPADQQHLNDADLDLGSSAPAILPAPANSQVPHLAVQGGKDGLLRLLNLDNLSGQGGPGHTGGEVGTEIKCSRRASKCWRNRRYGSTQSTAAPGPL